jgi:hypothetical protein
MKSRSISPRSSVAALMLCLTLLGTAGTPLARADEASRTAKVTELMRLTGLAQMLAESKLAGQAAARKMIQSMSERMFAKFPAISPQERARIEGAGQQFQRDVDDGFDRDDAVKTWGRLYSENLTDADLDAVLAFYRSPVGQKDVTARAAAFPQFQRYMVDKNTAVMNAAVANYTAALRGIIDSPTADGRTVRGAAKAGSTSVTPPAVSASPPVRPWDSNPTAPNGVVIPNPPQSERCEVTPTSVGVHAHAVPPSGRSLVCVCIDEKGTLTRDPVIAESSGDSRVDSGAVKMARSDSGRYQPPILDGQRQRACFRFAIDFKHQQ